MQPIQDLREEAMEWLRLLGYMIVDTIILTLLSFVLTGVM